MRSIAAALIVGLVMLAPSASAQEAGVTVAVPVRAPSPCDEPTASSLLARVPDARREGWAAETPPDRDPEGHLHAYLEVRPRVLEVELDGPAPREAVLSLNRGEQESASASAVFVFACRGVAWELVGDIELEIDRGWYGTLDDDPGVVVLRPETIAGIDHDLLRVEHVDVRGSHDPRFIRRRFLLLHVVGGALVTALDVVVREHYEGGPSRETTSEATRTLILRPGTARTLPRYRFVFVLTEGDTNRRAGRCSTWLVFDGRTFVPSDRVCAQR